MDPNRNTVFDMDSVLKRLRVFLQERATKLSQARKLWIFDEFRLMFWNEDLLTTAISTRLPKWANHEREPFEYLDLARPDKLNSQTFDTKEQHTRTENLDRFSEEIEYTQCAKKQQVQVNYESGSMPSESPGKTRHPLIQHQRRPKSKPAQQPQHDGVSKSSSLAVASGPSRSRVPSPTVVESDNDAEDEGEESLSAKRSQRSKRTTNPPHEQVVDIEVRGQIVSAKRKTSFDDEDEGKIIEIVHVKKKQRRSLAEGHIINLDEDDSPKALSSGCGKEISIEVEAGDVGANAAQVHNQSTKPPSSPWYYGRIRLAQQLGRVHPRFPIPPKPSESEYISSNQPTEEEEPGSATSMTCLVNGGVPKVAKRRGIPSGTKPINNLCGQSKNLSVVVPQDSQKRKDGDTQEVSAKPIGKPFKLVAEARKSKRQRTGHQDTESVTSHDSADLDAPTMERRKGATRPNLGNKKQTSSDEFFSLEEFSGVEGIINPAPKSTTKSHPSDTNTRSHYFPNTGSTKPATLIEDATDPISDSDVPSRQSKEPKTYLSQTYKGSANLKVARAKPLDTSINDSSSKASATFIGPDAEIPSSSVAAAKRKRGSIGDSEDELAAGHCSKKRTEKEHAQQLLRDVTKNGTQNSVDKEFLTNGTQTFMGKDTTNNVDKVLVELSTDDEKEVKKAEIAPTKFKISNRPKPPPKKNVGKISFKVMDAFSTSGMQKTTDDEWRIVCNDKSFGVVDADEVIKEQHQGKSLRRIIFSDESAKLYFDCMANLDFKRPTQVYVELKSADDRSELVDQLSKLNSEISRVKKDAAFMDKAFLTTKRKRIMNKLSPQQDPELELITKNSELRQKQKRAEELELKRNGMTRSTTSRAQHDTVQPQRAEGRARKMESSGFEDGFPSPNVSNKNSSPDHGIKVKGALPITRKSTRIERRSEPDEEPHFRSSPPISIPIQWTKQHPEWEKSWRDAVIYPPGSGHKRTATVDREDISRLDEEEFLNDNLVNFYLRYLEFHLNDARPEVAKSIYFQNSYFYERLTKPMEGRKGGIDYKAVQRWTKDVDLFSKDFIIVPVCENLHWYVAIICNAPKLLKPDVEEEVIEIKEGNGVDVPASRQSLVNPEDENHSMKTKSLQASYEERGDHENTVAEMPEAQRARQEPNGHEPDESNSHPIANVMSDLQPASSEKPVVARKVRKAPVDRRPDPSTPRIIIIDSLGGTHPATSRHLKDYLIAEMKDKHGKDISLSKGIGFSAKNIDMQNNWSDCGLYLLSYIQKFLEDPERFISIVLGNSAKGDSGWLRPSKLRHDIRDLLIKLSQKKAEGVNPFLKTLDVTRPTVSSPASRDASTDRTDILAKTERSSPAGKSTKRRFMHDGLPLHITNGSSNTSSSSPRVSKAALTEDLAKMPSPATSRPPKRVDVTSTKEVTDLQDRSESIISSDNVTRPKSKSTKPAISAPDDVIDVDESSTLQEVSESLQAARRSSLPIKKRTLENGNWNFQGIKETMTGFMGFGRNVGDKEGAKDMGSSELQPFEIDDSPVKYNNQQNHRKRRESSSSVEILLSSAQSKRQRVSQRRPRDSSFNQEKVSQRSDVPDCPGSPGLLEPYVGDIGQRVFEPSSPTTARKDESPALEDEKKHKDDDEEMLITQATKARTSKSASKSKSPATKGNLQPQGSSPSQDDAPFKFYIHDVEDDSPASQTSRPAGRRSGSQQSLVHSGTHTRFDT